MTNDASTTTAAAGHLVLITGPIASGKTTTAFAFAARGRESGLRTAAIDMDDLVEMVAGKDWRRVTREHWDLAFRLAAAIIERLFSRGVTHVALAGPVFALNQRRRLLEQFSCQPETTCVLLRVSLAESINRAQNDPLRIITKDPAFVTRIYATIDWSNIADQDLDLDTESLSPAEVVDEMLAKVLAS
jgi:shikimate kinase